MWRKREENAIKCHFWRFKDVKRICLIILTLLLAFGASAQKRKVQNRPYIDQRRWHYGFLAGIHVQDYKLVNTGYVTEDGQSWFADVPEYSPGFTVGVLGELYLNRFLSLRLVPTLHFGDKRVVFREQASGEEHSQSMKSAYLSVPIDLKFAAERFNNYRPYLIGGIYGSVDIGRKKGNPILLKSTDFGFDFGLGCDIYLPYFKLCPELKFCFGLVNLLEKDRPDLVDQANIKYTDALSKATSRMVILTFNFE